MAKRNVVVDGVSGVSVPLRAEPGLAEGPPRYAAVTFQQGQTGLLDTADPKSAVWAEVLDDLRRRSQPAYVEIDPETKVITELLCPLVVSVAGISKAGKKDDVEVELVISHARHYLRRSNPDFSRMLKILRAAKKEKTMVVVTESQDGHEIIDVRPHGGSEGGGD